MKHLERGNLIVQKTPIFQWWLMQGDNVTDRGLVTKVGQAATVLEVNFTKEAPLEGYVDAIIGHRTYRTYIKVRKWRSVWEVA